MEYNNEEYKKIKYQHIFHLSSQATEMEILRFQALTIISSISIVVAGFIITESDKIKSVLLATIGASLLSVVLILSLFIYLHKTRKNISCFIQCIQDIPSLKPFESFKSSPPAGIGYMPEILAIVLIIGILFFLLSLIEPNILHCWFKLVA